MRDVGPVPDPKEWTKERTGDVKPLYAEIAALAKASTRLRDAGGTINAVLNARKGEKDIKPGLNFVAKLSGKGETGFVDGQGVFRGPTLPVSLEGPLPKVAVMLGPEAFRHGKDGALGVLRHELKHAEHFQTMIDWLAKWRKDAPKGGDERSRFDAWVDRHKGIGKVERSLLLGERQGNHANTELLAFVEGFITTFHLRQVTPSVKVAADYPPALYELRRAGEEYGRADSEVKAVAMDRLRDYVKTFLTAPERAALKGWLTFLADSARAPAANVPAADAPAAKLLHSDFKPIAGFLKQLQGLVP